MKFKKLTAILSAGILSLCSIPMGAGAEILKGDVNHDGFLDPIDATLICEYYSNISIGNQDAYTDEEHAEYQMYGDISGDGCVDTIDATFILIAYSENSIL